MVVRLSVFLDVAPESDHVTHPGDASEIDAINGQEGRSMLIPIKAMLKV
jgi:hypothetical protein